MNLNFSWMRKIYYILWVSLVLISCEALLIEPDLSSSNVTVLAPLNNTVVESNNVNFNWDAVTDATKYQLQVAQPDFVNASQLLVDSIMPETSYNLTLEPNEYQWRVKAMNENSETVYSTVNFTVQPEVFEEDISEQTLVLIAPSNDSILEVNPIVFTWEEIEFAESYILQIATPDFENATQVVVDEIVFGTTSEQSLVDGQYQWRVKAKNSASETLFTSSNFNVELIPIEVDISDEIIVLTAPSEGSELDTNPVIFSWEELETAENYVLQIATPNFENPAQIVVDISLAENSSEQTLVDGTYQWRVKGVNSVSETDFTTASFTMQIDGSNDISDQTVLLIAPSNGSELNDSDISFNWEAVPYAENYKLQIATPNFDNPTQVLVDEMLTETSFDHTFIEGSYQWRVKAINSSSETNYTTSSFTVLLNVGNDISGELVSLIAPSNGSVLDINPITFTWNSVPFAEDYVLQIATPNFTNPTQVVVDETLTETSSTQSLEDGNYQWRVKARNSSSETLYSVNSFEVDTGIAFADREVIVISPPDGFVSNLATMNLQWQSVEDATLYRIQILDANTSELIDEETTSQTTIAYNFPEGNLIWQVRAETSSESTQYTAQDITIDSIAPNIPLLLTPIDSEILNSTTVNFTWSRTPIEGTVETDRIYIYEDENLTNLVLEQEVSGGSFSTTMSNNQTYYWLMKAFDVAGNQSENSEIFSFTITP